MESTCFEQVLFLFSCTNSIRPTWRHEPLLIPCLAFDSFNALSSQDVTE